MLEGLEHEAREGGKGLCADPQPVPPWEVAKEERGLGSRISSWRWRASIQPGSLSAGREWSR